ncbi:MAG: hypothetical protein IKG72_13155 [Bacillus sp. (in: Bacteria)]|nr:hypothetical protein [Parasporobacterium sp.]MBR3381031.1 hypothetical protein [Bacillus sp. (in: firmicutes)]
MTLTTQQAILAENCRKHDVRYDELPRVSYELAKAIKKDFFSSLEIEANREEMEHRYRATGSTFYDNTMKSGRRVWNNARHPVQTARYDA